MAKKPLPTLSIVVPVYNGSQTIGNLVDKVAEAGPEIDIEFILVNDGSKDDSSKVCGALFEAGKHTITFIDLSRNFGEHNALITGLRQAKGDYVVTMDDDLQNPPHEVFKLFEYTRDNKCDVTYSFYEKKEDAPWRNLGSKFANMTANYLLDKPKGLYLSSFRCMTRFVAEQIGRYEGPFPYVDGLIFQITQSISSLKVEHHPRAVHQSNYTIRKLVRLWLSIFLNFSVKPLRVATLLGLSMSGIGLLGSISVLAEYFIKGTPVQGRSSLMLSILVFSGVQLTILGLVGEYIGRIYMTVNQKPQAIIRNLFSPYSQKRNR